MDQRERNADLGEAILAALDGRQVNIWTALPAIVESYDPTKLTITAQPVIKINFRSAAGTFSWVDMPLLIDVPVVFPSAGGLSITLPLAKGDEVLVVFASRCIDGWWEQGGVQLPPELRFHDLSDGFAIPGPRSQVRLLSGVSATNLQIRTEDGSAFIEITPAGKVTINVPAEGLTINGNVTVTGSILATGEVTANTAGVAIPLSTHLHGGVTAGGADTGVPIP
jgi:hypothetical protein